MNRHVLAELKRVFFPRKWESRSFRERWAEWRRYAQYQRVLAWKKPKGDVLCPRRGESLHGIPRSEGMWDKWLREGSYRYCSYCGSMHPEDVIEALATGATYDPTDKGYKGYLQDRQKRLNLSRGSLAKFYLMHFDKDQIERANAEIRKARANKTNEQAR